MNSWKGEFLMTNTKNKKNNTKKLLGAVGMLSISAAMLVSSTFAWFTMNRTVTATSMQVQAKGEGGLLISEVGATGSSGWDNEATFAVDGAEPVRLYPASTYNSAAWWHANSTTLDQEAGNTDATTKSTYLSGNYTEITGYSTASIGTATANSTALGTIHYQDADADNAYDNGEGYYMQYTYYLKTSADGTTPLGTAVGNQNVQIKVPAITAGSGSGELDKSLRVGVALDNYFYIFAPVSGYDGTYFVTTNAGGTANVAATVYAADTYVSTHLTSLDGITSAGIPVNVYVWFEGEDAACKSSNLTATLDQLDISVEFKLTDISGSAATAGGVQIVTT
jgi:hypothetical protein